jgi:acetolactate synthase small subunit
MRIALIAVLLAGCGKFVIETKGKTSHEIAGGTTNTIVITVDFTPCELFSQIEDREDCMRALLKAMENTQLSQGGLTND